MLLQTVLLEQVYDPSSHSSMSAHDSIIQTLAHGSKVHILYIEWNLHKFCLRVIAFTAYDITGYGSTLYIGIAMVFCILPIH